jgi:hypothetical protein
MGLNRFYLLLALWCVLMIAPATALQLGAFGRLDMRTNIPGGAAGLWILGYLAQFFIFMWIMRVVGKQKILWWFFGSMMPWVIDWTVPVHPSFLLLWAAVLGAMASWIALVFRWDQTLQQKGIRASGVVLQVFKPWFNVVINNVYIRRKLRLRVEREDGVSPYEANLKGLFMLGEIPSEGDRIPLVIDPGNPKRFEYDKASGSQRSTRQERPMRTDRPTPSVGGNIAEDLEKLSNLRDRGAITETEFNAAKKKLLRN